MLGHCFVIQYELYVRLVLHFDGEEKAGCFTLTVFLMHCDSQCSVPLLHDAVGW